MPSVENLKVAQAPGTGIIGDPFALGDRQGHVFESAEPAEQRVDLEGAG